MSDSSVIEGLASIVVETYETTNDYHLAMMRGMEWLQTQEPTIDDLKGIIVWLVETVEGLSQALAEAQSSRTMKWG